jgi:uncharacterized sporulation protein YeaH/YhbH (DUF444 family)
VRSQIGRPARMFHVKREDVMTDEERKAIEHLTKSVARLTVAMEGLNSLSESLEKMIALLAMPVRYVATIDVDVSYERKET